MQIYFFILTFLLQKEEFEIFPCELLANWISLDEILLIGLHLSVQGL